MATQTVWLRQADSEKIPMVVARSEKEPGSGNMLYELNDKNGKPYNNGELVDQSKVSKR